MITLVINAGSSTVKYALFRNNRQLCRGIADRIGFSDSFVGISSKEDGEKKLKTKILNHEDAISKILELIIDSGCVKGLRQIDAIGHRVVHGGELFKESALIDNRVISAIKKYAELAPLHNPPNLYGIEACMKLMPGKKQVAVFDTSFHQTIPKEHYLYPIPLKFYERYKIRRYGFHGISHNYVAEEAARILKKDIKKIRVITCHLGGGASITAIKNGKSIDTSMGFTPLEGLMMCTRAGDLDAGVPLYIMSKEKLSLQHMDDLLNKESGIKAILGFSSDFRDILKNLGKKANNEKKANAKLAFEMFVHRVRKYIGAYAAVMNGVDVIVFTAGIGENSCLMREKVLENLEFLGVKIDKKANRKKTNRKNCAIISAKDSKVKVLIIKTDEELKIAAETERILNKKN